MNAKEILEETKKVLDKRGWTRKPDVMAQLDEIPNGTWLTSGLPLCLGLAIRVATPGGDMYHAEHQKAMKLITDEINPDVKPELCSRTFAIYDWNDADGRTRADVDKVLDAAIAKA